MDMKEVKAEFFARLQELSDEDLIERYENAESIDYGIFDDYVDRVMTSQSQLILVPSNAKHSKAQAGDYKSKITTKLGAMFNVAPDPLCYLGAA